MDRRCLGTNQYFQIVTPKGRTIEIQCFLKMPGLNNKRNLNLGLFTWEWMNFCASKGSINVVADSTEQVFKMEAIYQGIDILIVFVLVEISPHLKDKFDAMAIAIL